MPPLISILIPVYNRDEFIGPCIESSLNQTIDDVEIIVVDNASTDGTWDACQSYANTDSRVRIFRNETNIGPVRNWQRCIDEARGRFGKFLFSDDLIKNDFCEKACSFMENEDVAFVFSTVIIGNVPWKGVLAYEWKNSSGLYASSEFIKSSLASEEVPVSPGAALFRMGDLRKNLIHSIPSPTITDFTKHGAGPDLLLYLVTALNYPCVGYLSNPCTFFRVHEGSITISSKDGYIELCYTQAKIWLASSEAFTGFPNGKNTLDSLIASEWIKQCYRSRKIYSYSIFIRQYTEVPIKISKKCALEAFVSLVKKKILRQFRKSGHF
jgi:glycosyltransferase involved in cell wall biosynthesis